MNSAGKLRGIGWSASLDQFGEIRWSHDHPGQRILKPLASYKVCFNWHRLPPGQLRGYHSVSQLACWHDIERFEQLLLHRMRGQSRGIDDRARWDTDNLLVARSLQSKLLLTFSRAKFLLPDNAIQLKRTPNGGTGKVNDAAFEQQIPG